MQVLSGCCPSLLLEPAANLQLLCQELEMGKERGDPKERACSTKGQLRVCGRRQMMMEEEWLFAG